MGKRTLRAEENQSEDLVEDRRRTTSFHSLQGVLSCRHLCSCIVSFRQGCMT